MDLTKKPWKVVMKGTTDADKLCCEDNSIFTTDNEEVIGCSEWLRCDVSTLRYIVNLHNRALKQ